MIGHHARRSCRLAALRRRLARVTAWAVTAAIIAPSAASAQVFSIKPRRPPAPAPRTAAQQLDPRVAELLQMAPYYAMFEDLSACARQSIIAALNAAASLAAAEDLTSRLCDANAHRLRALLAREVGVEQAALFYQIFKGNVRRSTRSAWQRKPGPPPIPPQYQVNERRRVGNWSLEPQDDGGCRATFMNPQPLGSTIILYRMGAGLMLRIGLRTDQPTASYRMMSLSLDVATLEGPQHVKLYEAWAEIIDGTRWYTGGLPEEALAALAKARGFRTRTDNPRFDSNAHNADVFVVDPIAPILDILKHC